MIEKSEGKEKLISTEIGYTFGACYTSMSGAFDKAFNGAGNILLYAWSYYLKGLGFTLWDLGMKMGYKVELGGKMMPRKQFVQTIREMKDNSLEEAMKNKVIALEDLPEFWEKVLYIKQLREEHKEERKQRKLSK